MALFTTTADKGTTPLLLVSMSLTNETRETDSPDTEDYRAVLRVTTEFDAYNITDIAQTDDTIASFDSLPVGYNDESVRTLFPLKSDGVTYPFKLLTQSFQQMEARGSSFFKGIQEFVSVTPWKTLDWS